MSPETQAYSPHFSKLLYDSSKSRPFPLLILREDIHHPFSQGNKFWKLKYNILDALQEGHNTLLTFGGAYSNHIHATAAAGKIHHLKTIGIIRGEEPPVYSPTLEFARAQGMTLHFISREEYRQKSEPGLLTAFKKHFGKFHLIPEGGSNAAGFRGCVEWGEHLAGVADIYCLASGSGATAGGIAKALWKRQPDAKVLAFPVLKNGGFLKEAAETLSGSALPNLTMITDYHFGGYAKHTPELLGFIAQMHERYQLPLEHVYTGKTLYGILDLADKGHFPDDKKICFIHTGGLQGKLRG